LRGKQAKIVVLLSNKQWLKPNEKHGIKGLKKVMLAC